MSHCSLLQLRFVAFFKTSLDQRSGIDGAQRRHGYEIAAAWSGQVGNKEVAW